MNARPPFSLSADIEPTTSPLTPLRRSWQPRGTDNPHMRCITGASIMADSIIFATLVPSGSSLAVYPTGCTEFILAGREQHDCMALIKAMYRWMHSLGISAITLRASPYSGKLPAKPAAYKIETLLQLIPVQIDLVNAGTLSRWYDTTPYQVPPVDPFRFGRKASHFEQAVIAAAYTAYGTDRTSMMEAQHAN